MKNIAFLVQYTNKTLGTRHKTHVFTDYNKAYKYYDELVNSIKHDMERQNWSEYFVNKEKYIVYESILTRRDDIVEFIVTLQVIPLN